MNKDTDFLTKLLRTKVRLERFIWKKDIAEIFIVALQHQCKDLKVIFGEIGLNVHVNVVEVTKLRPNPAHVVPVLGKL